MHSTKFTRRTAVVTTRRRCCCVPSRVENGFSPVRSEMIFEELRVALSRSTIVASTHACARARRTSTGIAMIDKPRVRLFYSSSLLPVPSRFPGKLPGSSELGRADSKVRREAPLGSAHFKMNFFFVSLSLSLSLSLFHARFFFSSVSFSVRNVLVEWGCAVKVRVSARIFSSESVIFWKHDVFRNDDK